MATRSLEAANAANAERLEAAAADVDRLTQQTLAVAAEIEAPRGSRSDAAELALLEALIADAGRPRPPRIDWAVLPGGTIIVVLWWLIAEVWLDASMAWHVGGWAFLALGAMGMFFGLMVDDELEDEDGVMLSLGLGYVLGLLVAATALANVLAPDTTTAVAQIAGLWVWPLAVFTGARSWLFGSGRLFAAGWIFAMHAVILEPQVGWWSLLLAVPPALITFLALLPETWRARPGRVTDVATTADGVAAQLEVAEMLLAHLERHEEEA